MVLAQTSKIISSPKQYTLDLATLNKKSYKKEHIGSKARKLAKIVYKDSLKEIHDNFKHIKFQRDSITEVVETARKQPGSKLTGIEDPREESQGLMIIYNIVNAINDS